MCLKNFSHLSVYHCPTAWGSWCWATPRWRTRGCCSWASWCGWRSSTLTAPPCLTQASWLSKVGLAGVPCHPWFGGTVPLPPPPLFLWICVWKLGWQPSVVLRFHPPPPPPPTFFFLLFFFLFLVDLCGNWGGNLWWCYSTPPFCFVFVLMWICVETGIATAVQCRRYWSKYRAVYRQWLLCAA